MNGRGNHAAHDGCGNRFHHVGTDAGLPEDRNEAGEDRRDRHQFGAQPVDGSFDSRSLYIGISCGLVAAWSAFRVVWMLYIAMTFGWYIGALAFQFVLWTVIGAVAAVAAYGFVTRHSKGS